MASKAAVSLRSLGFQSLKKHIVKYLAWYLRIYPSSHILLLQSDSASLLWKPNAWQAPVFDPATKTKAKTKNGILLHVFSNGGCYTAVQLAEFYSVHQQRASATTTTAADAETTTATTTTSPPQELPIRAFILDSSPGAPGDSEGAIKALNASLTWWLAGQTLAYLAVGTTFALTATGLFQPAVAKAWARLKDAQQAPAVVNVRIARTYLFSDADQMIRARDVKLHARLKEYLVRCEEFTGTPHVNHMASDPERYWRVVKETWAASALLVGEER
ncbi:hypothetical protein DV738_g5026, partial [Chaetothyriales sp. CBS 135597]